MNAPDTTQKSGKIILVGFGPGAQEHMSYRARAAIAEAGVVIGYATYIKLVQDLLDGKEVIRKGMTEELDRCNEAWEHARQGKTVAVISSGDAVRAYSCLNRSLPLIMTGYSNDCSTR